MLRNLAAHSGGDIGVDQQLPVAVVKRRRRGATIGQGGLEERHIQIRAYVSGKVTEEDINRIQCVSTEVIADFPDGYTIDESSVSVDEGELQMLDFWAFFKGKT